jgi:PAS domain S-box-containing protein
MQPLRGASIRQKLTGIVLVASGVAVLVACTVFAIYDFTTFRRSMASDLTTVAEMVGANTTAALTFGDPQSAQETLNSLRVKPHIVDACILGLDGHLFATYSRQGSHPDFTKVRSLTEGVSMVSGHMLIFQTIRLNGDPVGKIYLNSDLNELYARAMRFVGILLVVLLASFLAAYLLASRLQSVISEPILDLARTAFTVSTGSNYSVRAKKRSDDEIGFLFDRFNEMLEQIQQRDSELLWTRDEMEVRVDERTRELQVEIAERKHAERNLEERTTFLNSLIENTPIATVALDADHNVQMCNPAFENLFCYRKQDVLGLPLMELVAKDQFRESAEFNQKEVKGGATTHLVTQRSRSDGSLVEVEIFAVPLVVGGKISGALVLYQDITERKRAEVALLRAKEAAEAASRAKSEFLANMSHEIRTPMNGIIGMTGLALDTNLTAEQREYLSIVKSSADSLLTLINDILDFSKIEAGKLDLESMDFPLRQSLGETMKTLGFRAHEKGLELAWRVEDAVPEYITGDLHRLRQVLVNLIGNAVKFTEHGEVVVVVTLETQSAEAVHLHFTVKDTGIGIPPEKQDVVFDAFTQADGSTTRKYGGTGLGLAITTQIVQLMSGKIWLESEVGRGSTFHFTAPFGIAAAKTAAPSAADPDILRGSLALVVDDNKTNRIILAEMLARWGMRVESAGGAEAALTSLDRLRREGREIALIITDLHMPHVDGFDFARKVRTSSAFDLIPILLLSSSTGQDQLAQCREAGIAACLMKPVQPSELLDAVMNAVFKPPKQETSEEQPPLLPSEGRPGMKVLLAEDNAVNRTLARKLLEKFGHTVVIAENGRQVLEALRRESVDLVLMDVQMPAMDGLEATAAIREKEKSTGAHLPIIALTAHAMKGDRERCLAAGADDYLTKPIHTPDLLAVLDRIRGIKTTPHPPAAPPPAAVSANSFDLAAALQRVEGDRELLEELARLFAEECPKFLAGIRRAFDASDAHELARLAHTVKGSASNLGASAVTQSAIELEKLARASDFRAAAARFKILESDVKTLLAELEAVLGKVAP